MPTRGKLRLALTHIRYALYNAEDANGPITEVVVTMKHRNGKSKIVVVDLSGDTVTTDE